MSLRASRRQGCAYEERSLSIKERICPKSCMAVKFPFHVQLMDKIYMRVVSFFFFSSVILRGYGRCWLRLYLSVGPLRDKPTSNAHDSSLMWDTEHLNDSLPYCDFCCLSVKFKCYKNLNCYKKAECFLQLDNLWT